MMRVSTKIKRLSETLFVYPDKERTIELYERENKRYLVPNILIQMTIT